MVGRRRKDVDDSSPERKLATSLDKIRAQIATGHEVTRNGVKIDLESLAQNDRSQGAECGNDRLEDGAHGCTDHA